MNQLTNSKDSELPCAVQKDKPSAEEPYTYLTKQSELITRLIAANRAKLKESILSQLPRKRSVDSPSELSFSEHYREVAGYNTAINECEDAIKRVLGDGVSICSLCRRTHTTGEKCGKWETK